MLILPATTTSSQARSQPKRGQTLSFLARLLGTDLEEERSAPPPTIETPDTPLAVLFDAEGSTPLPRPTEADALRLSAVYACVSLITSGIQSLPVVAVSGPLPTWCRRANRNDDMADVLGDLTMSLLLRGNAFASLLRDAAGRVGEVVPLDPSRVSVEYVGSDVRFRIDGVGPYLTDREIMFVHAERRPGELLGVSPLGQAMSAAGLALAAQDYGAAFFANGAYPGLVIEAPNKLSPDAQRLLKSHWDDLHKGVGQSHRIAVATEGAKFSKVSLSPDEAQFLQTRQFSVPDIARFFRVPPHLIADASNSTSWGSGLAEQSHGYALHTLSPWADRLGRALTRAAGTDRPAPAETVLRLSLDALTRADMGARYAAYKVGIEGGWLTAADVRRAEGLDPLPANTSGPIAA